MDEGQILTYISITAAVVIIIAVVVIYFSSSSPSDAVQRAKNNNAIYDKVLALAPLGSEPYKLCDYYIASSAYTVFPGSSVTDYISDDVIPLVVKSGARLIELDIYDGDVPSVGLKNQTIGYDYAKNSVSLEKCCIAIGNSAFSGLLSSDPFILSLMFHTENNNTLNASSQIIRDTLGRFLLGPEYAFHRKNLAQEPIENLKGKLIIVSGGAMKHTKMHELVNLSWSTSDLRRLTYMQASQPYDHDELIESNKKSICMVVPDPDPDLKNNNPIVVSGYGCQWNLMNYGSLDSMMELNIEKFQQGSIVLKPEHLRFKPVEAKVPILPDPATHSFQPMMHTSPIYDMNPQTGDKSIVI
jgi:hypothetical protein